MATGSTTLLPRCTFHPRQVKSHLQRVYVKLGISSRSDLLLVLQGSVRVHTTSQRPGRLFIIIPVVASLLSFRRKGRLR